MNLLVLGGGAIAIYFVGKNVGLWGGSSDGVSSTATSPTGNTAPAAAPQDIATLQSQGQTPNYTATQYQNFADTIFAAGNTAFPFMADSASVLAVMNKLDDDIDVAQLIQAFGTRTVQVFWTMDLYQFMSRGFTDSARASFNQQLQYNGVKYQF